MNIVTDKDGIAYTTLAQIGKPIAAKIAEGLQAIVDWDVDACLPQLGLMLVEMFDVSYVRAVRAANALTLEEFSRNLEQLEAIVGVENAAEIVRKGKFLEYSNSTLESYLKLASAAAHKMKTVSAGEVSLFYSITSLACVVDSNAKKKSIETGPLNFNIRYYKLLHRDNEQSQAYLNALIDSGALEVGEKEHWCKGNSGNGPRGGDILKKIGFELLSMFGEFGFPSPQCKYPQGQHCIIIPEEARLNLRKVRDFCVQNIYVSKTALD
ncbi:hypothetical protein HY484_02375 [Candidatus Woesearchaeota archaeon]|nr:hypothetical protein [Candidatus Woesearchaeota archaeon]